MQAILINIVMFLSWTLILYWFHRGIHHIPQFKEIHQDHHNYVTDFQPKWNWKNIFIWVDTWKSTADQWITEVIPTVIFCYITGYWWIAVFYWAWSAIIQEVIEHNPKFNIPLLTSGQWHLIHHRDWTKNFGVFFSVWDRVFGTYEAIK
jgi:Delta7-sterol 5-desaturase